MSLPSKHRLCLSCVVGVRLWPLGPILIARHCSDGAQHGGMSVFCLQAPGWTPADFALVLCDKVRILDKSGPAGAAPEPKPGPQPRKP